MARSTLTLIFKYETRQRRVGLRRGRPVGRMYGTHRRAAVDVGKAVTSAAVERVLWWAIQDLHSHRRQGVRLWSEEIVGS